MRRSVVGGCVDQVQREVGWCLVSKRRMGALGVVVNHPIRNDGTGVNRAAEHGFVQEFVAHATVEAFHEAILHRLARRDVVPFDVMRSTPVEDRV